MNEWKDFDLLLLRVLFEHGDERTIHNALSLIQNDVDKEIIRNLLKVISSKERTTPVLVELLKSRYSVDVKSDINLWNKRLKDILECELKEGDIEIITKEAERRWKKIMLLQVMQECESGIKSDSSPEIISKIDYKLGQIKQGFQLKGDNDLRSVLDVFIERISYVDKELLYLGFPTLDGLLGGLKRKTLSVVLAPTNMGKTSFMIYLSFMSMLQNYNVLYITLEDLREIIETRLLKTLLGDVVDKSIEEKMALLHQLGSSVYVRCLVDITVKDVEALLQEYDNAGIKIDVLIIDYADLMKSGKAHEEEFIEIGKIFYQLLHLAIDKGIWVISGSQAARMAVKTKVIGLEHVSRSFRKVEVAHYVFGLLQAKEEQEKNQVRLSVLKNKFGVKGVTMSLDADWQRCMFKELE